MKVIKPPSKIDISIKPVVFLAGSIEMGKAINWQQKIENYLSEFSGTILNPRRDEWDSSWKQEIQNNKFKEQVEWELTGLEQADVIAMYFDKDTKSPITLLELGLQAATNPDKLIVCCPEGFWRKGNVDIVCNKYCIQQYSCMKDLKKGIINAIY